MTDTPPTGGDARTPSDRIGRAVDIVARGAAVVCGYAVTGLAVLVVVEILGRKLFDFSIQGADEIGGYVLAVVTALGFSVALVAGGHTRIDIFLRGLGAGARRWLDVLCLAALAGFSLFMTYSGYHVLAETIEYRSRASTPLETPLWIPQSVWLFGLALFSVLSLYALSGVIRGALRPSRRGDRT